MRIDIRFWTAMAVIGICVFSVTRGWRIVHFSLATENIDVFEWAEVIDTWTAVPEVASAALREKLKEEINIADPKAANGRGETFSSILSIGPSSSLGWLSLSGLQSVTHQPLERVLGSLRLSMLTGPNEGYAMGERGVFGVSLWESLSPDLKRGVVSDLAGAEMNQKFRTVLSAQPVGVRNELREALLATGLSPKEIEARLGF
jgi:hypothetical protein